MQCINPTHFPSSIYAFHIIYLLIDVNSTSSSLSVHCVHSPTDPVSAHGQHLSEEICIDHIANGLHVILLGSQIRTFCSKALKCWVILLGDLCILDSKCCLGMRISDVPKIQLYRSYDVEGNPFFTRPCCEGSTWVRDLKPDTLKGGLRTQPCSDRPTSRILEFLPGDVPWPEVFGFQKTFKDGSSAPCSTGSMWTFLPLSQLSEAIRY